MIRNLTLGNHAIEILETGSHYGNMNTARAFYPDDYTPQDKWSEFLQRRIKVGKDFGFDGRKMFMADQEHRRGSWFMIDQDYVEAHPEGWSDIPEDILIVTHKTPGVVIGHPVADCPVVMAFALQNKVTAIGHCSADLVDIKMPMLIVDALQDVSHCSDEDIKIYVSACAGKSWTYDKYPAWAKDDEVWADVITLGEDGLYHIDLKKAVLKQLRKRNVGDIIVSPVDTITDSGFYSNSAARLGNSEKKGRNFAGAFFR